MNYRRAAAEAGCDLQIFYSLLYSEWHEIALLPALMECLICSGYTWEKTGCCLKIEKGLICKGKPKLFDSSSLLLKRIKLNLSGLGKTSSLKLSLKWLGLV